MAELSILIPARNEMFLAKTIENILENIRGDTEVIAVLDGGWAEPQVQDHEKVNIVYHPVSVGQRAATNDAARVSNARYVMKCDAHCAFSEGFDVAMMEDMEPDITLVPTMYNLHAFDWVCEDCGERRYQGPSGPCTKCGGLTTRDILWNAKHNPKSTAMRFDRDLKFQYWSAYKKKQGDGPLLETMSCLGACWMLERERYFALDICDESHGSWGQQGTEVACKTWLSGGRLMVTTKSWFAHMFRTQGGDFGFPYRLSGSSVQAARNYSWDIWRRENPEEMPKWDGAIHPLQWLIDKFSPVPGWETPEHPLEAAHRMGKDTTFSTSPSPAWPVLAPEVVDTKSLELTKGIVYYTDNRLDPSLMEAVQAQLAGFGLPIASVSLEPLELWGRPFGMNVVVEGERGPLTMFRQILAGLQTLKEHGVDVAFFAEHDVIYHHSHFAFTPSREDVFYYNNNVWKVDLETGKALFHYSNHTSQLCAFLDLLLKHYQKRVALVEAYGFSNRMGYEPGTHGRKQRVDDYGCDTWMSEVPNLDIRHGQNLTRTRWKKSQFRNQRFTKGWKIADEVPGWGRTGGCMKELLHGLSE